MGDVIKLQAVPAEVRAGWRQAQDAAELGRADKTIALLQQGYLRGLSESARADLVTRLLGLFGQGRNLRLVAALVDQTKLSPGELVWLEAEELAVLLGLDLNDRELIAGLADDLMHWKA
jgi:hypothetical protein